MTVKPAVHVVRFYDALSKERLFDGDVVLYESKGIARGTVLPLPNGDRVIVSKRQQKRDEVECRLYVLPHPYGASGVGADEGGCMIRLLSLLMGLDVDETMARYVWGRLDGVARDRVACFARMYSTES